MSNPTPEATSGSPARQEQRERGSAAGPHSQSGSETAQVAQETKAQMTAQAEAARQRALRHGREFADRQKQTAAEQLEVFGLAAREAAHRLQEEGQESVGSYTEVAADRFDQAAGYLRERDFPGLYQDASRWARQRPEIFLGGMFIAGLALSRFLKASSEEAAERVPDPGWESADREAEFGRSAGRPISPGSSPATAGDGPASTPTAETHTGPAATAPPSSESFRNRPR